jgi:hypothetical protein
VTRAIARAWLWTGSVLLILSGLTIFLHRPRLLTDLFFVTQDLPVLVGVMGLAGAFLFLPRWTGSPPRLAHVRRPAALVLALAGLSAAIALAGAHFILDDYPLSLDEFMATFGATIHSYGQLLAPLPMPWQDYAWALQPYFSFITDDGAFWTSSYLPVNAALRGLMSHLGGQALTGPLLAAISVVATWGVGRRIWPERPAIALIAAILLATSSQFLMMAMTPYAMTAHLAFNMVWLWLFLRGGRLGHGGAIAVAFFACGIHQLIFHPLFAAPFVLQLWLERRWRVAGLYTLAYAAIALFWIEYWPLALRPLGEVPPAALEGFTAQAFDLISDFDPASLGLMAKNLIRFATWQNLLVAPLVVLGARAAFQAGGAVRALILGLVLTALALFLLQPYPSHGWGYRYLNGLLGSACLLGAWQWGRLTQGLSALERGRAKAAFITAAAVSIFLLFPIRAWQARSFSRPYAMAAAAVRRAKTPIVLVDDTGSWFTIDLVRNDPYLRNRPLVLSLADLEPGQFDDLCSRFTISIFDPASAASFGIRTFHPAPADPELVLVKGRACGHPAAQIGEIRA